MAKTRSIPPKTALAKHTKPIGQRAKPAALTADQSSRRDAFKRYLEVWLADDSGEQVETWKVLKKALDENRTSLRKHFND